MLKKVFLLFFLFPFLLLLPKVTNAQDCTKTTSNELHSYRPYPGDPCNVRLEDLSLLCGNDMIIKKKVEKTPSEGTCNYSSNSDTYTCSYVITENVKVAVDTSQSRLPIMGNTELVYNLNNDSESLDDTQKMNDFVSWYLNGTLGSTNNPYPLYSLDLKKIITGYYDEIINFSGPINKLAPKDVQYINKMKTVENAVKTINATNPDDYIRHDQIVGCTYGIPGPTALVETLVNLISGIFGQKYNIPLSRIGVIIGPCNIKGVPKGLELFLSFIGSKKVHRLSDWDENKPPLIENYEDTRQYWIDYKRWRGESCAVLPFWSILPKFLRGMGFCVDNPFKPNYYADIFVNNIPLSSTEDRIGNLTIGEPQPQHSEDIKVEVKDFKLESAALLFFPHMQETYELAGKLQDIYVPKEGTDNNLGYTEAVEVDPSCTILQVRSGDSPGDSLLGTEALAKFRYIAEFICEFSFSDLNPICKKEIVFTSNINTNTPLANQVWASLVAGNSSIVKRLFPKMGTGGLGTFLDMPTVTTAEYKVKVGDVEVSPKTAEIYFPHIGSIEEYFLKGIQTLLRPKGYGEEISFGQPLDYEQGDCSFNMEIIQSSIQSVAAKYKIPESLLKAIFEIEALPYIANPSSYQCQENSAGAAGIMSITKSTYNIVVAPNERLENDIGMCGKVSGKLSRCNIEDNIELAAKVLIYKAGRMSNYQPTGGISASEKNIIYQAAWKYYGSLKPDELTKKYDYNLPNPVRSDPPGMNYADIVCNKMGLCPPYP